MNNGIYTTEIIDENNFKISIEDEITRQKVEYHYNLMESKVREALIRLGWTPPEEK